VINTARAAPMVSGWSPACCCRGRPAS
jgi:hypothetical protein